MTKAKARASATGCFQTRNELTSHVWAISRQQVFRNSRAIATACGVTTEVVNAILEEQEGLKDYLVRGCPMGA
jgi:hypothetical protein